ncbi:MAG: hypothetical protein IIB65_06340 [Proteobacteria bacterium]|nr:hypothetical protein [Pseudomonadota bacterium]
MPDPFADMSESELLETITIGEADWSERREVIRGWRAIRNKQDDVLSTVPPDFQVSDFEYHDSTLDESVLAFSSILGAAVPIFEVTASKDDERAKADREELVLKEIYRPNGILDQESAGGVRDQVNQNRGENGHGIYKQVLKRDYPLSMPQRRFADDQSDDFERNSEFNPRSRKDTREEKGLSRFVERTKSLDARRAKFFEDEFAWQWTSIDPETVFRITQDGKMIGFGEVNARPSSTLHDHNLDHLMDDDKGFIYLDEAEPKETIRGAGRRTMVTTFEFWTSGWAYFGFLSHSSTTGLRTAVFSGLKKWSKWKHSYGRPPYYESFGRIRSGQPLHYRYDGAFPALVSETPLLNSLETIHHNMIHRGAFPFYQLVRDRSFSNEIPPLDAEQTTVVATTDQANLPEAPPGYTWDLMPNGVEPNLTDQLSAARERVKDNALAAVLRGASVSPGDSGAKVSLLLGAAQRTIDPFRRHEEAALTQMAENLLMTSKRLGIDLILTPDPGEGDLLTDPMILKAKDIVSVKVKVTSIISLPVDEAANETRAMQLKATGLKSYMTYAADLLNVGDPERELERINLEKRDPQLDQIAFLTAQADFSRQAPEIFGEFMGMIDEPEPDATTIGGGPEGTMGGATAAIGQGRTALGQGPGLAV